MTRTTARSTRLATALVAGALVLAACGDDSDAGPDATGSSDTSTAAEPTAEPSAAADFSDADVTFATGMVPHHESAIEMAQLAEGRAADPRVLDLAVRIEAAQGPEIEILSAWLERWGADEEAGMDHGGMDHGSGGMMSEQDMQALMNATGAGFDRMFLTQMIEHHRGAVQMAETEAAEGSNSGALAMAESIRDSQSAEIAEMEQLLTEMGG